jgi:hypothetical protein
MDLENENLAADAINQAAEGDQQQGQQAASVEQSTPAAAPTDPYEAELAQVQEQLKAEQPNGLGDNPVAQDANPAEGTPADAKVEKRDEPKVPVSAVYKERKARQAAELRAAQLEGALIATQAMQKQASGQSAETEQPDAQEQQAEPEATDELGQLFSAQDELAKKFDSGEISAVEWTRQNRQINQQIEEVKTSKSQEEAIRTDQSLDDFTTQLVTKYPVVNKLNAEQVQALTQLAYTEASGTGTPIKPGIEGTKVLRQKIAEIATRLYGTETQDQNIGQGQSSLTPAAAARGAKLDLAQSMPPDVSKMGSAASGTMPSDSDILARMEKMTDDEANRYLDSMPMVKARLSAPLFGTPS